MSKSLEQAADVTALLKARNALLWIPTREESRVEGYLFNAASPAKMRPYTWDCANGVCDLAGKPDRENDIQLFPGSNDLGVMLSQIEARANVDKGEWGLFIMRDMPAWIPAGMPGAIQTRQLRNLARKLSGPCNAPQAIVVLTPSNDIPPELSGHATVIEWPLPDREEIAAILDVLIKQYDLSDMLKNGQRESAIDAAVGLSGEEAQACYSKSLVQLRKIDPVAVAQEKKRIIAKQKVLQWYDPLPGGLDMVGGLGVLKSWFLSRSSAYTPAARAYGLPLPKGCLLVGPPGTGKTLCCKAIATALQRPLLRFDINAALSKFVGESGGNIRSTLQVADAIGPCIIWIDEVEKALQGSTSSAADGGVAADILGTILTWLQERNSQAFVVMTANDVTSLPPELLRKGRLDEIWFVDLPNSTERGAVLQAAMKSHGRKLAASNNEMTSLVSATDGFSGAEIAAMVPDAMYAAFADGARDVTVNDLLEASKTVVPLSRTAAEKIQALRNWAKGRARYATAQEVESKPQLRVLDIG